MAEVDPECELSESSLPPTWKSQEIATLILSGSKNFKGWEKV